MQVIFYVSFVSVLPNNSQELKPSRYLTQCFPVYCLVAKIVLIPESSGVFFQYERLVLYELFRNQTLLDSHFV